MGNSVIFADFLKATINVRFGVAAMKRNCFDEAIHHFDRALEFDPDDPLIHWNRATSLLSLGNYVDGFKEFEWRWKMYDWRWGLLGEDIFRVQDVPQWHGEDLRGKHLLFYWEMGYGDGIQQLRYVPLLLAAGAEITALYPTHVARLARLFDINVIETVPEDVSRFDYRCSLFGVMTALAQTVGQVPGRPYLPSVWEFSGGNLGIAWSGRTQTEFDLSRLLSCIDTRGYQVQALQPGDPSCSVLPLPLGDFLDTAHVVERMEHIVTVDTAVAHLAGAMGHPSVHVLIPYNCDWRWNFGGAWYPRTTFYRQKIPGDWAEAFAMLNGVLRCSAST